MISREDKELVNNLSTEDKITLWDQLNSHKPNTYIKDTILHFKCDKPLNKWTKEDYDSFKTSRAMSIMGSISSLVSKKEILYYTNVVINKSLTEEEFKDFWEGNYEGNVEAQYAL